MSIYLLSIYCICICAVFVCVCGELLLKMTSQSVIVPGVVEFPVTATTTQQCAMLRTEHCLKKSQCEMVY